MDAVLTGMCWLWRSSSMQPDILCLRFSLCHTVNHWWSLGEITEQWLLLQRAFGIVCESQTVKLLASLFSSWEKECFSAVTEEPSRLSGCSLLPPTAVSPEVSACLPIFFFLSLRSEVWMWMPNCRAPPYVSASLCNPWLHEAVSSGPWQAVHIFSQRDCAQWLVYGCRASSLLSMWVSQDEWIAGSCQDKEQSHWCPCESTCTIICSKKKATVEDKKLHNPKQIR